MKFYGPPRLSPSPVVSANPRPSSRSRAYERNQIIGFLKLLDSDLGFRVPLGGGPLIKKWWVHCLLCQTSFWVSEYDLRRAGKNPCCVNCVEKAAAIAAKQKEEGRQGLVTARAAKKAEKREKLVGERFGRLEVVGYVADVGFVCQCASCGKHELVQFVSWLKVRGESKCKGSKGRCKELGELV